MSSDALPGDASRVPLSDAEREAKLVAVRLRRPNCDDKDERGGLTPPPAYPAGATFRERVLRWEYAGACWREDTRRWLLAARIHKDRPEPSAAIEASWQHWATFDLLFMHHPAASLADVGDLRVWEATGRELLERALTGSVAACLDSHLTVLTGYPPPTAPGVSLLAGRPAVIDRATCSDAWLRMNRQEDCRWPGFAVGFAFLSADRPLTADERSLARRLAVSYRPAEDGYPHLVPLVEAVARITWDGMRAHSRLAELPSRPALAGGLSLSNVDAIFDPLSAWLTRAERQLDAEQPMAVVPVRVENIGEGADRIASGIGSWLSRLWPSKGKGGGRRPKKKAKAGRPTVPPAEVKYRTQIVEDQAASGLTVAQYVRKKNFFGLSDEREALDHFEKCRGTVRRRTNPESRGPN